jgi:hypothetical protein
MTSRTSFSGGPRYYRRTITHVCGHTTEHHIPLGIMNYKEPTADDLCITCSAAEYHHKMLNSPEWLTYDPMCIKGSEKQVKWAKDIRKHVRGEGAVMLAKLRAAVDAGAISPGDAYHFLRPVFMVLGTMLTSMNAREIIDLREYDPIIQAAFHLDHWSVKVEGINQ